MLQFLSSMTYSREVDDSRGSGAGRANARRTPPTIAHSLVDSRRIIRDTITFNNHSHQPAPLNPKTPPEMPYLWRHSSSHSGTRRSRNWC